MLTYAFDTAKHPFFTVLRKRVDDHFAAHNIHHAGNSRLLLKSAILFSTAVALYTTLVFFTPAVWASLALCVLLGINLALIGFNIMHDGGHQTFSKHRWVNVAAAHFLNILGGNAHFWQVKHNVNHHTYTNIEGMDSDIDVKPFMRLHHGQPLRSYHRFQHLYWIFLYGISYLAWIFYEDFQKYFSGKISANGPKRKLSVSQHITFWTTKVLFALVYMAFPIYMLGWLPWLVGFLLITFVCGVGISVVFQLAHVVEGTQFFMTDDDEQRFDWAVHQVRSTANFATRSKFLYWLLGGLNFQVEHHLFPRISHIHYPIIARYVRQTCQEYGVVYHEYKNIWTAFVSHLSHLHALGRPAPMAHGTS
jgi:linoleoyl-CoA desaturase